MAEDTYYLTVNPDPDGRGLIAVMSLGSPQVGDANITILSVEIVKDKRAANRWFDRMKVEQPWRTRN